ncbi:MAG: CpsD/CapB family tyrosine-protein kinase [Desulfatibacillaceae bacterium]
METSVDEHTAIAGHRFTTNGHELSINYTKTRVMPVDAGLLERNRVISSCRHMLRAANQVKTMRTRVVKALEKLGGNCILVAGARSGEGRTLSAINLAISIAQQVDRTSLLVDADLRDPPNPMHAYFGWDRQPGLSGYLLGKVKVEDALVCPGINRMVVFPSGRQLDASSEALGGPRMAGLVAEMKARYDDRVILLDSPPLLERADALVLSRLVDGVILVVEAERTSTRDVEQCLELLADRPIIGTIFNKAR